VEDEALIAMSEAMTLEKYGYGTVIAGSGEEASRIAGERQDINLILMDIDLGSGIDGTKAAASILEKKLLPIIFLSSHDEPEIIEKTSLITSYGYISKNSGEAVLLGSVKMAFRLFESLSREKESDEFSRRIFENSKIPIIIMDAMNYSLVDCNPASVSLFGFKSKEEMLGLTPVNVSPPNQYDGTESSVKARQFIDKAISEGQVVFEWLQRRPDGSLWDAEAHLMSFVSNGKVFLQLSVLDITNRKQAEQALRDSEERFKTLSSIANEGIIIHDQGIIIDVNLPFARLLGYSNLEEIIGKDRFEAIRMEEESRKTVLEHINNNSNEIYDIEIINLDGQTIPVETCGRDIVYRGRKARIVYMREITERKRAEEKVRQSLHEKEILLRELYHRTKNTLQITQGLLTLQAADYPGNTELQNLVKNTGDRIESMSLVHKMLYKSGDLSRISIKDYIQDLSALIMQSYRVIDGRIALNINIEDQFFQIDAAIPFGLIINELITNSMKYAFPGNRKGNINISLKGVKDSPMNFLEYSDDGAGVEPGFNFRNRNTLGLKLIYSLGERQLSGKVYMKSDNGIKCVIEFEKPAAF
jgi:PAS domain S-box-containing protein